LTGFALVFAGGFLSAGLLFAFVVVVAIAVVLLFIARALAGSAPDTEVGTLQMCCESVKFANGKFR